MKKYCALVFVLVGTLFGCDDGQEASDPGPDAALHQEEAIAYVLGAAYQPPAAVFSSISLPSLSVTDGAVDGVATSDPVIRQAGDRLYVINRGDSNVTILDASSLSLIGQHSLGSSANPWDVAVVGDKLYAAAWSGAGIVTLDLSENAPQPAVIDLSEGASTDDDPGPNASALALVGDDLYVALELLDASNTPTGPGKVAVIDTTTDQVRTTIELTTKNPLSWFEPTPANSAFGDRLLIGTIDFADGSGCIETIEVGDTPTASCLVTNEDLGGNASDIEYDADEDRLLVAVSPSFGVAKLVAVEADGTVGSSLTPEEQVPTELELCPSGHRVVIDFPTEGAKGVRVYDDAWNELTSDALDVGLPAVPYGAIVCR